ASASADPPAPLYISQRQVEVALRRQRCARPEPDGKNPRAAVEATVGAIKRPFGNDKLPVRGKFRMASMVIGSAAMVNLRRIQRFQVEQRREATKKAKGKGIETSLLSLFSHISATFLKQFYSVTSFSPLYY
ncbi:MAG TPA: hypothetical protein G4N96_02245, partial [Chloroflexi bacterium]|nr:hypothetical protein [Chloroflexota bacterium]